MITADNKKVYLAVGPTDMRKQINGLTELVAGVFGLDVFSDSLFVFLNRRRDIIRILEWDSDGFWLHTKRLERGRFMWPDRRADMLTMDISGTELMHVIKTTALQRRFKSDEVVERIIY